MTSPSAAELSGRQPESHGFHGAVRAILLTVSIVVLSAVVPATLMATVPAGGRGDAWVLTLLVIIWGGVRLSFLWVSGEGRLFDFFFVLFCYIFMGIAPTIQIRSGLISTTTSDIDVALDLPTTMVVWLGIGVYEAFRLISGATMRAGRRPRKLALVGRVRGLLLLMAGFVGSAIFISKVGVTFTLASRTEAFQAREQAWPDPAVRSVMYATATYPLLIGIGAMAQLRKYANNRRIRWVFSILAVVSSAVLLMIVNPIASARYTFGTVAFALVVYLGALETERRRRWLMLSTILSLLFLFPLADAFRNKVVDFGRSGFFDEYLSNADYDAFWQIANALDYWLGGNVVILYQVLGSLLFWVPRALWPNKPMDTGTLLAQYRGYSFENLSAPMWAELLVNGGLVAVVVGFAALGWWLRRLDGGLRAAFRSGGTAAIVGAVFPVYMTILMRGSLLQATGSVAVGIACLLFIRKAPTDELDSGRIGRHELPRDGWHPQPVAHGLPAPGPH